MSVSEDISNGIICELCGVWMPEVTKYFDDEIKLKDFFDNPPGYTRKCKYCRGYLMNEK